MTYTLLDAGGQPYESERPGSLGGHRGNRVYGRLDCAGALRWIERGHYVPPAGVLRRRGHRDRGGVPPLCELHARRVRRLEARPIGAALQRLRLTGGPAHAQWGRRGADRSRLRRERGPGLAPGRPALRAGARQLDEYFAGERTEFELSLRLEGSPFQRLVWEALRGIPYGTTTSYGELAEAIGSVGGARKVGSANARNPIAIVVPCHRVIGADGKLVGYGGGSTQSATCWPSKARCSRSELDCDRESRASEECGGAAPRPRTGR